MTLRHVRATFVLLAALGAVQCAPAPSPSGDAVADESAIRQMLVDWYAAYSGHDEGHYRTFVANDYVLLENGLIMGLQDDLKYMREKPSGYARKDAFDFQSVRVYGDTATATFFLESEIVDDKQIRQRRWLESTVIRRIDGRWRASLLHSTRIPGTDTPR